MITRITAKNFRGIILREVTPGAGGVVAKGRNGAGKTSLLRALQAALEGRDIGPDAIRQGSDKAEVVVDLDDMSIRRAITAKGSTLTIKTAAGDVKSKPQQYLSALFGASIDPCALLLAKPKERVAMVQAAIPLTVTREQLAQWAPGLPAETDCTGHGLAVIARVREWFYEKRRDANAVEKAHRTESERLAGIAEQLPPVEGAATVADAEKTHRDAAAVLARLHAQDETAKRAEARMASTRERIAATRRASDCTVIEEVLARNVEEVALATRHIEGIEKTLAQLRTELVEMQRVVADQRETVSQCKAAARQADALESALTDAGADPVDPESLTAAEATVATAMDAVSLAHVAAKNRAAHEAATAARGAHDGARAEAERLDGIVRALTDDAPRALVAAAGGIEGLSIDGDDVSLDGVRFDGLCGAEQVHFAVSIARRANAKGRVLIVDGLERLDPEQQAALIESATADSWQLFATAVSGGDLVDAPIEAGAAS